MLSLDTELAWGCMDIGGVEKFRVDYEKTREIIDRLLRLLERYEIPATWALVGHLFLADCSHKDGVKHPEIVRPKHDWVSCDWFALDPMTDLERDPVWYGRDIVEKIRSCPVPQEIACHSFSHVIFGDRGCSRETAASEVRACVQCAEEIGATLRSFVFPRNSVGHLDVLKENGFLCYRGQDPCWHQKLPGSFGKIGHMVDQFLGATPPVVEPIRTPSGLVNLPGSQIYLPAHGFRRWIPVRSRVRKALRGLHRAVREGKVFHLWLHPFNLARKTEALMKGLEQVFKTAADLREGGRLRCSTMGDAAQM